MEGATDLTHIFFTVDRGLVGLTKSGYPQSRCWEKMNYTNRPMWLSSSLQSSSSLGTSYSPAFLRAYLAVSVSNTNIRAWILLILYHNDVIKWKHYPRYWPFVRGIHWSELNKRLSKQSWGWWFETPSHSLWRHCNAACHSGGHY